jgi:hypothetical protein
MGLGAESRRGRRADAVTRRRGEMEPMVKESGVRGQRSGIRLTTRSLGLPPSDRGGKLLPQPQHPPVVDATHPMNQSYATPNGQRTTHKEHFDLLASDL